MLEPAMVLVLIVKVLFNPEPVSEMAGGVMQDFQLVGTDPAADVIRVGVFCAGQNHVPVGDQVIVLILLQNETGCPADGSVAMKNRDCQRGDRQAVNGLAGLSDG